MLEFLKDAEAKGKAEQTKEIKDGQRCWKWLDALHS